jgi:dipeptidyl aminopeptidase/acylaminoacyl peptidase
MGNGSHRAAAVIAVVISALWLAAPAPSAETTVPVLSTEVPAGRGSTVEQRPSFDPPHKVDGKLSDWRGRLPGFGGVSFYSSGERIYQDHVFDAHGADDGDDAQRLAVQDPLTKAFPESYRVDGAIQYVPGEFGIPTPPGVDSTTHYGDLEHQDEADLSQLRIAADARNLWLLARTTTMSSPPKTALLVLIDSRAGSTSRGVPFGSGIRSTRADYALLVTPAGASVVDLATGATRKLPANAVAYNPTGYTNAIEARVPRALVGATGSTLAIAAATGLAKGVALEDLAVAPNVANVAFRAGEPPRDHWDKRQALALEAGGIDEFFESVRISRLRNGASERFLPGPGYWDRIFRSSARISQERGQRGVLQHYGVYLPSRYTRARKLPLQFWFHFRGGSAHIAAHIVPGIFRDMGETPQTIVVTPDGRGTSRWYVGIGHVDFREVWADLHRLFNVDRDRTYTAGHSMGGWASYLLPILYPDYWAASFPASAPVTQGAWTGVDFAGCDEFKADEDTTPCYVSQNGGDPRVQHVRPLLDNLRWVPLVIFHGAGDYFVPLTGELRNTERLSELGYRWRLYVFPHQEHYGPPVVDQWGEGVRYEHRFVRDRNPARVTYIRSMPFERATERIQSDKVQLDFDFDRAYWMSKLTPADPNEGVARFDGRSLAILEQPHRLLAEAGGAAATDTTGPWVMTGQAWEPLATTPGAPRNAFEATLTGTSAVRLDLARMQLQTRIPLFGDVTTEKRLRLELTGAWPRELVARVDGRVVSISRPAARLIAIQVPAGRHRVVIERSQTHGSPSRRSSRCDGEEGVGGRAGGAGGGGGCRSARR